MHLQVCQKELQSRFDEDVTGNSGVCKTKISSSKGFLRHVAFVLYFANDILVVISHLCIIFACLERVYLVFVA